MRRFAFLLAGLLSLALPPRLAAADADPEDRAALSAGVAHWLEAGVGREDFSTGAALFDAEWLFGTWMMAAVGFGEAALQDPDPVHRERLVAAVDRMLAPEARAFDHMKWGSDPLEHPGTRGRIAWLGYAGVALGMERLVLGDEAPHRAEHERIVAAILQRFATTEGLVETYPGEWYPVDNAAAIGALGLHHRATGVAQPLPTARLRKALDPATGLLRQATDAQGRSRGPARGSGSFLASWFLSFAQDPLADELYAAGRRVLWAPLGGLGAMREYPPGVDGGGDIDSGPIVAGRGVSATGFALGAARAAGDEETARALWATTALFGAPATTDGATRFATGGPIGDAILFAMLGTERP